MALNTGLSSCEKNSSQEEPTLTIGELTVNQEKIGMGQAFELSCPYKMENGIWHPTIKYSIDGSELKVPQSSIESFKVTNFDPINGNGITQYMIDNNTIRLHINGLKTGEHQVLCQVISYDGATTIAQKSITVNVLPSDVRTSFWGESLEDTKRSVNLTLVNEEYHTSDEAMYYGDYIPYPGKLDAYYHYTNDKLTRVTEVQKLLDPSILLVHRFIQKVKLIKENTNYNKDVKLEVTFNPGGQIEEGYQEMLEQLVSSNGTEPTNGVSILGSAVLSGNIGLKYTAKSNNTSFEYIIIQNEGNNGVSDKTIYSPLL